MILHRLSSPTVPLISMIVGVKVRIISAFVSKCPVTSGVINSDGPDASERGSSNWSARNWSTVALVSINFNIASMASSATFSAGFPSFPNP